MVTENLLPDLPPDDDSHEQQLLAEQQQDQFRQQSTTIMQQCCNFLEYATTKTKRRPEVRLKTRPCRLFFLIFFFFRKFSRRKWRHFIHLKGIDRIFQSPPPKQIIGVCGVFFLAYGIRTQRNIIHIQTNRKTFFFALESFKFFFIRFFRDIAYELVLVWYISLLQNLKELFMYTSL